jgi:hypothetical protein
VNREQSLMKTGHFRHSARTTGLPDALDALAPTDWGNVRVLKKSGHEGGLLMFSA